MLEEINLTSIIKLINVNDMFKIAETPVTVLQWIENMPKKKNPKLVLEEELNLPIVEVTILDAIRFCNRLSGAKGLDKVYHVNTKTKKISVHLNMNGYRLPTSEEWEYAARGEEISKKYPFSGSHDPLEVSWNSENSHSVVQPVGQLDPNEIGLYDMSGNVWEFCLSGDAEFMDIRGGSVWEPPEDCAIAARRIFTGDFTFYKWLNVGFRVVRTIC